ncbi:MAG: DUF1385 domain-containing protein [Acidobacteria bacterium]|nr:DUF1385 domain-containing protein [Acidobacteriota bacterium]
MSSKEKMDADILVGGQAVLEGVMMRTPNAVAVAVRQEDGEIVVRKEMVPRWIDLYPLLKLPLIRGTAILVQSLILGIRSLNFSAEVAMEAEARKEEESTDGKNKEKKKDTSTSNRLALVASLLFSLAGGLALFVFVPYWLSGIIVGALYPASSGGSSVDENWLVFNLIDGAIRVIIFIGYILAISLMKDIRRVFQYHGAEHKVVHMWEAKETFSVENAAKYTTLHPRCGTSFLMFVLVVSIIVFTLFKFDWWVLKVVSRVFLLPLIAGISYELIRLSAKFPRNAVCKFIMQPGLLMQKITTQPPSDDMLEVSLRALQEALSIEEQVKKNAVAVEAA